METPIRMDDLGGKPLFLETPKYMYIYIYDYVKMIPSYELGKYDRME